MVIFDLDGTLLDGPSSERRFILHLAQRGLLRPKQVVAAAVFPLRHLVALGGSVLHRNKAYLNGLDRHMVAAVAAAFVEESLIHDLDARMVERLKNHLRAGDPVVLLTGAPHFIADPLAARLGIDEVVATLCAENEGFFTSAVPVRQPLDREKVALARAFCAKNGCTLDRATAYADSWADRHLLSAVGLPVVVAPGRRLRRLAAVEGWEIMERAGRKPIPVRARTAALND